MSMQFSPALVIIFLSAVLAGAQTSNRVGQAAGSNSIPRLQGIPEAASSAVRPPTAQFPDLPTLIERLEAAQQSDRAKNKTAAFTVTRQYELFRGDDKEPQGTVIAEVQYLPSGARQWEIKQTSGAERTEKVVKRLLEREAEDAKDGKIDITDRNYNFVYAGSGDTDHRPCYILQLVPRRDDPALLRGRIWVDRDTYRIRRVEGEPAKSPTWWIKDLKVSRTYAEWGGIWLPTSSTGLAVVRVFGPHTMTENVVSYRSTGDVLQAAQPPQNEARAAHSHRPTPAAGIPIIGER